MSVASAQLVVRTTLNIVVMCFFFWVQAKFLFWAWPQYKWLNIGYLFFVALDYALIVSKIRPNGLLGLRENDKHHKPNAT